MSQGNGERGGSPWVRALLTDMDADALRELGERLAPVLREHLRSEVSPGPWLDAAAAAAYIGAPSRQRLYDLKRQGRLMPSGYDQSKPLWHVRDLDAYLSRATGQAA